MVATRFVYTRQIHLSTGEKFFAYVSDDIFLHEKNEFFYTRKMNLSTREKKICLRYRKKICLRERKNIARVRNV